MIKINLASTKQASYVSGGKGNAGSSVAGAFQEGLADWVPVIKKAGFPLAMCLAANIGYDYFIETRNTEMKAELVNLDKEKDQINKELQKIKGFESVKVELERNELVLRAKIDTIEKLIRDRDFTVKTLIALAQSMPKDIWLTSFGNIDKNYEIKGGTIDIGLISDFMSHLGQTIYFKDVTLKGTQGDLSGHQATFELTARKE